MPITSDFHLHSNFSGDSTSTMESLIQKAIALGLDTICFTEHHDEGFPATPQQPFDAFLLNTDSYLYEFLNYKEKYKDQIRLLFGVELGIQPHLVKSHLLFAKAYDFDFIIASTHLCNHQDPYYPAFYEGRSEVAAHHEYFEAVLENIRKFQQFDVCGHLDYVVRYGPSKNKNYSYHQHADILDEILTTLIENEKGLEINTGGLKSGLGDTNPSTDILKRYKELGGEIITIGSDAHTPSFLAYEFDKAASILKSCGFEYYTLFANRLPEFRRL